jgi:hypothetical protein
MNNIQKLIFENTPELKHYEENHEKELARFKEQLQSVAFDSITITETCRNKREATTLQDSEGGLTYDIPLESIQENSKKTYFKLESIEGSLYYIELGKLKITLRTPFIFKMTYCSSFYDEQKIKDIIQDRFPTMKDITIRWAFSQGAFSFSGTYSILKTEPDSFVDLESIDELLSKSFETLEKELSSDNFQYISGKKKELEARLILESYFINFEDIEYYKNLVSNLKTQMEHDLETAEGFDVIRSKYNAYARKMFDLPSGLLAPLYKHYPSFKKNVTFKGLLENRLKIVLEDLVNEMNVEFIDLKNNCFGMSVEGPNIYKG